jgi:hypothetical protein
VYTQDIPDHFIQDIQDRFTGANDATGNFLFVGSVPAAWPTAGSVKVTTFKRTHPQDARQVEG